MTASRRSDRSKRPTQTGRARSRAPIAAMRRMRGRETQCPGELSDAQYGLLFGLRRSTTRSQRASSRSRPGCRPPPRPRCSRASRRAGLVSRVRSEIDRRVVLTSLTERGRELVDAHQAQLRAPLARRIRELQRRGAARRGRPCWTALATLFDELAEERSGVGQRAVEVRRLDARRRAPRTAPPPSANCDRRRQQDRALERHLDRERVGQPRRRARPGSGPWSTSRGRSPTGSRTAAR